MEDYHGTCLCHILLLKPSSYNYMYYEMTFASVSILRNQVCGNSSLCIFFTHCFYQMKKFISIIIYIDLYCNSRPMVSSSENVMYFHTASHISWWIRVHSFSMNEFYKSNLQASKYIGWWQMCKESFLSSILKHILSNSKLIPK